MKTEIEKTTDKYLCTQVCNTWGKLSTNTIFSTTTVSDEWNNYREIN